MASVVDSQEVKIAELAHLTGGGTIDSPRFVCGSVELLLVCPFGGSSPCFTTSPVANPVFITGIDENLNIGVVEEGGNLGHKILHPVSEEVCVHKLVALNPLAAGNTEDLLNVGAVQEGVGLAEVVAKGRAIAWDTDVVHVDLWVQGVTNAGVCKDLAEIESGNVSSL